MAEPAFLTVRLPLKIGPLERLEFWEEPLEERFEATGEGEVSGGGTMMDADGEIQFCDLEIALPDLSEAHLTALQAILTELGAPKNTQFLNDDGEVLKQFGTVSVVGVGLDGTGLPDSAYEDFDPDAFSEEIVAALGEGYSYGGSNAGERYTFFYYHGADGAAIEATLRGIAGGKPIGQGAQFVHLA
ncbi:hypothetical protein BC777_0556 [Yoonia maricola]|uniref:Uncharacterized protein n=1 Tax=Yoonia maricola TaxID=420999 RepID=A0A2M8WLB4_9RHOB|nr:hypothetical protein [Yoonia maricola]PJI91722.1 hypothetical protein BC777_0556 [Yoonia maricola]